MNIVYCRKECSDSQIIFFQYIFIYIISHLSTKNKGVFLKKKNSTNKGITNNTG